MLGHSRGEVLWCGVPTSRNDGGGRCISFTVTSEFSMLAEEVIHIGTCNGPVCEMGSYLDMAPYDYLPAWAVSTRVRQVGPGLWRADELFAPAAGVGRA